MLLPRFKQFLKTIVLAGAIALPFGVGMPVSAMSATPMEGMSHQATTNLENCLNQHHVTPGIGQKVAPDEQKNTDPEPLPLPYFAQFQSDSIPKDQQPPIDIVRSSSFRPPDIIRLTNNIRF